jgi:hypothetical protein
VQPTPFCLRGMARSLSRRRVSMTRCGEHPQSPAL